MNMRQLHPVKKQRKMNRLFFSSLTSTGAPVQERLTYHPISKWCNLHKLAQFRQAYTASPDVISSQMILDSVKSMTLIYIYIQYHFTKVVRYKDKMQEYTMYLHTRNDQRPCVNLFEKKKIIHIITINKDLKKH